MNWILGNYIFGFFGALLRWTYYKALIFFTGKKLKVSFINIWLGTKKEISIDDLSNNMINVILGIVFFILIAEMIISLG